MKIVEEEEKDMEEEKVDNKKENKNEMHNKEEFKETKLKDYVLTESEVSVVQKKLYTPRKVQRNKMEGCKNSSKKEKNYPKNVKKIVEIFEVLREGNKKTPKVEKRQDIGEKKFLIKNKKIKMGKRLR